MPLWPISSKISDVKQVCQFVPRGRGRFHRISIGSKPDFLVGIRKKWCAVQVSNLQLAVHNSDKKGVCVDFQPVTEMAFRKVCADTSVPSDVCRIKSVVSLPNKASPSSLV
jgi:hypothetical protein